MTTTTVPAPAWDAGETMQRLTFCLDAAVAAGRCHQTRADRALSRWRMRPVEACEVLERFADVSAAHCGLVLIRWMEMTP